MSIEDQTLQESYSGDEDGGIAIAEVPTWHRPSYDMSIAALEHRLSTRPDHVYITPIVEIVTGSWRRAVWLLEAQVAVTNLTAAMLEDLREEVGVLRDNGAAELVLSVCAGKRDKVNKFLVNHLVDRLSARYKAKAGFTSWEYPINSVLRSGAYRHTAWMLGNWVLGINRTIIENQRAAEQQARQAQKDSKGSKVSRSKQKRPKAEPIIIPDLQGFRDIWLRNAEQRKALGNIPAPFGGFRQFSLGQLRRKVLISLLENFPNPEQVKKNLELVKILLNNDPLQKAAKKAAAATNHLWRRGERHWRKPRRNILNPKQRKQRRKPLIKLGWMSKDELWAYYNQLRELRDLAEKFDTVRRAIETLARKRLPSYPRVYPVILGKDRRIWYRDANDESLVQSLDNLLQLHPVNRKRGTEHAALPTELARQAERNQTGYLQAVGNFEEPKLQPLSYNRTMRPGNYTAFAVLFREREVTREELEERFKDLEAKERTYRIDRLLKQRYTYEYRIVIGLWPHKGVPETYSNEQWQTHLANFRYLNAPETFFKPSKDAHYLVFPIYCGLEYQDTLFREVIAYQREQQARLQSKHREDGKEASIETCFPEDSAIAKLEILSERRPTEIPHRKIFTYKWNFYAHLSTAVPVPPCSGLPEYVVGIHEYEGHYHAVMVALDGRLLDSMDIQPDIELASEMEGETPTRRDIDNSERYVYHLVKKMVEIGLGETSDAAKGLQGIIALENTSWREDQTLLLNVPSQEDLVRPTARVPVVLRYKALRAGLLEPLDVYGVAPTRDCSACGARSSDSNIHTHRLKQCPHPNCSSTRLAPGAKKDTVRCTDCKRIWEKQLPFFACPECGHYQLAKINTATVVALKALHWIALFHQKAIEKQQRDST